MKIKKFLFAFAFAFLFGVIITFNTKDAYGVGCTSDQTCSGSACSEEFRGGHYVAGNLYCCEVLTIFRTNYTCKTKGSGGEG